MASDKDKIAELEAKLADITKQHLDFQKNVGDLISNTIKDTLPLATMAAVQAMQAGNRQANAKPAPNTERCHVCAQIKTGCEGKHEMMYVGPQNPRRFGSYPGQGLNGVWYKSPRYGVKIPVPLGVSFKNEIARWEDAEEDLRTGRVMMHDSGTLSPNENNTRQANPFGFKEMLPGPGSIAG
jgi:hypothetical protein